MRTIPVVASVGLIFWTGCEPSVATIDIDPPAFTLMAKDESKTFKATPKKPTGELAVDALLKVRWSSSDESIAGVVNGTVTAKKSGDVLITASVGEVKAVGKVLVSIPASIVLQPAELEIRGIGKSGNVQPVVKDENGREVRDPKIVWATSSSSVAMVTGNGKVDGVGVGDTVIAARIGALEAKTLVRVRHPDIAKIEITPGQRELEKVGDAVRLTATLFDAAGEAIRGIPVEWSTDNEKIATVSNEGLVTAVKKGKAKIAATAAGKTETIEITVKGLK